MDKDRITIKKLKIHALPSNKKQIRLSGVYSDDVFESLVVNGSSLRVVEINNKALHGTEDGSKKAAMTTCKNGKKNVKTQTDAQQVFIARDPVEMLGNKGEWKTVDSPIAFECVLPSGRAIKKEAWFVHIRSSDGVDLSANDSVLLDGDRVARVVGFWIGMKDQLMSTVMLYQKTEGDCLEGTVDDEDVPLRSFRSKCTILNCREYSRYKAALMRKSLSFERHYGGNVLFNGTPGKEKSVLDCDRCKHPCFLSVGFRL